MMVQMADDTLTTLNWLVEAGADEEMELIAHQFGELKEQSARLPAIVRAPHRGVQLRHLFGVEVANIHPSRDKQVDTDPKQQGRDKSQEQPQNAF